MEELEIGGQSETIQTTALLRAGRIPRRVLETCCHSDYSERPSANASEKILQGEDNDGGYIVHTNFVPDIISKSFWLIFKGFFFLKKRIFSF